MSADPLAPPERAEGAHSPLLNDDPLAPQPNSAPRTDDGPVVEQNGGSNSILIEGGTVLTVNDRNDWFDPGYILIHGDRIAAVGAGVPPAELRAGAGRVIDAAGKIVMPGLINAHVHLFQSFVRGLADDQPLLQWLERIVWPVFTHMTEEDLRIAALLGMVENIHGGSTAVIDNHYVHIVPTSDDGVGVADAICAAAAGIGLRYQLARGWADTNYHPALMESPERIFAEMTRLHDRWHGQAGGRIRIAFGPLIPWGCTDESMLRMHALAEQWDVMIQMHTAETQAEVAMNLAARGRRHVPWLAELGVLSPRFMLVHAVWLDQDEIEQVAATGATVVHCPVSNAFLSSGIAPVAALRRAGVPVALATDGQACNNGQEMLDLLKWTANLHKLPARSVGHPSHPSHPSYPSSRRPPVIPSGSPSQPARRAHPSEESPLPPTAADILRMACRDGARAYGEPGQLGSLEPGKKADLILVDTAASRLMPGFNPTSTLVNFAAGADVDTMIVNGEIIMQSRQLTHIDVQALQAEARHSRQNLLRRAGLG